MNVVALVVSTDTPLPGTQVYASTQLTSTDAAGGIQKLASGPLTFPDGTTGNGAVFVVTAVGTGTVVAQAIDTTGAPMGASVSGSYTISGGGGGTTFPLPTSLTVTVSA